MAAVAAGAVANFDPLRGLWVPGPVEGAEVVIPEASWTTAVIDEQLELTDLALRFAQEMSARVERSSPVVVRQIMLQHAGHTNLGLITLTDEAGQDQVRGHFEPLPYRMMKELIQEHIPQHSARERIALAYTADVMAESVRGCDCFAPIGSDLRQGVPFTDCLVGVATDPESGLSARALRFTTRDRQVHTGLELAVGDWHGIMRGARSRRREARRRGDASRPRQILLAPELLTDAADEMASQTDARFPARGHGGVNA